MALRPRASIASVLMNPVCPKLASMIHYQLPHWMEPPEIFDQLIDHPLAVLDIDIEKLSSTLISSLGNVLRYLDYAAGWSPAQAHTVMWWKENGLLAKAGC